MVNSVLRYGQSKWNLLLEDDRNDDDLDLIAYDAVYMYANEDSSTYPEYPLTTYQAVRVGDEEIATAEGIRYTQKQPRMNGIKLNMVADVKSIQLNVL